MFLVAAAAATMALVPRRRNESTPRPLSTVGRDAAACAGIFVLAFTITLWIVGLGLVTPPARATAAIIAGALALQAAGRVPGSSPVPPFDENALDRSVRSCGRCPRFRSRRCAMHTAPSPSATFAHEFGPFTIDRYAAFRVAPDEIEPDYVSSLAETPTQADGDTIEADPEAHCTSLAADIELQLDGTALTLGGITASTLRPASTTPTSAAASDGVK